MRASGIAIALCVAILGLSGLAGTATAQGRRHAASLITERDLRPTAGQGAPSPGATQAAGAPVGVAGTTQAGAPATSLTPPDPGQQLQQDLLAITNGPGVSRGTWGVVVEDLSTSERLFELNPRALLVPASTAKLVSLASAVDAVGWDYTFETPLLALGPIVDGTLHGDLVVVGSGDPSIGGPGGDDFAVWIDGLKRAGIRRIDGRIVGDDDAFEEPRPGAMWAWDDIAYRSGALFGALNLAENRTAVTLRPGAAVGSPLVITVDPLAEYRPIVNRTVTGDRRSQALVWPEQRPGEEQLTIAGSLPAGSGPIGLFVSVGNPTLWFVNVLRSRLIQAGIGVTGGAVDIDDLAEPLDRSAEQVVYTYHSPPLSAIAQPMLKESINVYAEAVLRLSTGVMGERTNDAALAAIKERLPSWGLDPGALQVVDGSGLSRRDTIAADTLVAILRRMFDPAWMSPWMTGLPIAGHDGTLANRMRRTPAENVLRAKSGTMSNIHALAGYVLTADRQPLAFAIIVNNFEGTGREANAAIDAIAARLATFAR
jgi:D-alanyl-D-alanine carboxypeptidase/D-alanyl-D-alanine-endopeptidase (penicillin-binding protein 4)